MIKVSFIAPARLLLAYPLRAFAHWDSSKSRAKADPALFKRITMEQSPVDINTSEAVFDRDLKLEFQYSPVSVQSDQKHKDHVILDVPSLGLLKARFNGQNINYRAKEVHINAPSEHKIDGHRHDMELHIHHENEDPSKPDNHFAVVSLLFKKAEQGHPIIDKIKNGGLVDLNKDIFNNEKGFFYYSGTHTAPPSIDHVNWFLLSRVLPVTVSQLRYLQDHWHEKHGFTNFRIT